MNVSILGLGTALPDRRLPQDRAMQMTMARCCDRPAQTRLMQTLYRRSGVAQRGAVVIDPDEHDQPLRFYPQPVNASDRGPDTQARMTRYAAEALPLAARASTAALTQASIDPQSITHIVTCSCTGFIAPGLEVSLIGELGLAPTLSRTNVGFMGCHGAFNALTLARSFILADPTSRVLVCSVELCSLHFAYGFDTQQIVANALFADGAATVILGKDQTPSPQSSWQLAATGSCILPDSAVLFILQHLRAADAPRPCVALGFGPGLAAEAMLFR